jgi:hypothetical protein
MADQSIRPGRERGPGPCSHTSPPASVTVTQRRHRMARGEGVIAVPTPAFAPIKRAVPRCQAGGSATASDGAGPIGPARPLPAPTGVSPASTTEHEQHHKNDQQGFHVSSPPPTEDAVTRPRSLVAPSCRRPFHHNLSLDSLIRPAYWTLGQLHLQSPASRNGSRRDQATGGRQSAVAGNDDLGHVAEAQPLGAGLNIVVRLAGRQGANQDIRSPLTADPFSERPSARFARRGP